MTGGKVLFSPKAVEANLVSHRHGDPLEEVLLQASPRKDVVVGLESIGKYRAKRRCRNKVNASALSSMGQTIQNEPTTLINSWDSTEQDVDKQNPTPSVSNKITQMTATQMTATHLTATLNPGSKKNPLSQMGDRKQLEVVARES